MDEEQRKKLRAPIGPLTCGGARGLGPFYGIYWPSRLKELIAPDSLSEQDARELQEDIDAFETDFKAIADTDAAAAISLQITRLFVRGLSIGSYASLKGHKQVQDEAIELARAARDRPELTDAIFAEFPEVKKLALGEAWKKAGLLHGKINIRLEKQGHGPLENQGNGPANQKSIYDRIVRILRT